MEVLTLPIWKTSTCLTLPRRPASAVLTWPPSLDSMTSAWLSSASDSNPSERCWLAPLSNLTSGAAVAAAKASRATRSCGDWHTSHWAGDPRCWKSPCAATAAPNAVMSGAKTPPSRPRLGPSSRAHGDGV